MQARGMQPAAAPVGSVLPRHAEDGSRDVVQAADQLSCRTCTGLETGE